MLRQDLCPFTGCIIWWSNVNTQGVLALVHTGVEVTIIQSNPDRIRRTTAPVWGLGEQPVVGKMTKLKLQIGDWNLHTYSVMVTSTSEYILGMDALRGATLEINGTYWAFGTTWWLHARAITVGFIQQEAHIPVAIEIVYIKQYKTSGGDAEIQLSMICYKQELFVIHTLLLKVRSGL